MTKIKKILISCIATILILFGLFMGAFFLRQYLFFNKFESKMETVDPDGGQKRLDNDDLIMYDKSQFLSLDGGNYSILSNNEDKSKPVVFIQIYPRIFNPEYRIQLETSDGEYYYELDKNLKITSKLSTDEKKIIDDNKVLVDEKMADLKEFFNLD